MIIDHSSVEVCLFEFALFRKCSFQLIFYLAYWHLAVIIYGINYDDIRIQYVFLTTKI